MSKRISLSELEIKVLKSLFSDSLNNYYSDANIAEMELEERMQAEMERTVIRSILKKII